MKKNILSFITLLAFGGVCLTVTSCKDAADVKDLKLSQVLSATDFTMTANADLSVTASWSQMFNADQYELIVSQDETFSDASQEVYSDIISQSYTKGDYCSVDIPKLDPETKYYGRVQALASDGSATDSKYVYANVTTVAEQIMEVIGKADIQANSVTIRWTAGEFVKAVEVMDVDGEIIQTVTPTEEEIEAGEMTIDELDAHTTYTIRLVSAVNKTRGRRTFTTLLDLSDATVITAAEGADGSWVAKVEGAAAGAVFAFEEGDYKLPSGSSSVKITNNVVLAAKDITKMPTLYTYFEINNNASLYCYYIGLTYDATADPDKNQCFVIKSSGTTGSIDVEGCEIKDYVKGLFYIDNTTSAVVSELNITGCFIHDIICTGGDFMDTRLGGWETLNFKNNTVVNCFDNRAFVRVDVFASLSNVENNTFYNCGKDANGDSYGIFTNKDAGAVSNFNNNIVEGYKQKRGFNGGRATATVTASNNVYYSCLNLVTIDPDNTSSNKPTFLDENGQVLSASPFKDAAGGDFRLVDPNLRLKQVGASTWYEQDITEE